MSWKVVYNKKTNTIKIAEVSYFRKNIYKRIDYIKTITKENDFIPVGCDIFTKGDYLSNEYEIIGDF